MLQYNSDELYHYGVLGMKWGKRKAAKQEHRLTVVRSARDKAKNMYDGSSKDSKELQKRKNISDAELEKKARNDFGNDWSNKKYMKDVWGISSLKEYRDNYNYQINTAIKGSKAETKALNDIIMKFDNISMSSISKKDYKKAKDFIDNAYYGGGEYSSESHAKYLREKYG